MKKIRILACLMILCLLLAGCKSGRKAAKQLESNEFLYASGTSVLDATGQPIRLASKSFAVSSAAFPAVEALAATLAEDQYNSITLDLQGEMINDTALPWQLHPQAISLVQEALALCTRSQKYLFVDISDYPQAYKAWYEDADFLPGVIGVWQQLAELIGEEPWFGGYVLSGFPRTGASEEQTALEYYEQVLQQICDGIREKDAYHMICIGAITPYSPAEDAFHGFPLVSDANVSYCASIEALEFYSRQARSAADGVEHLTYPNTWLYNVTDPKFENEVIGSDVDFSYIDYQTRATPVFKVDEEGCLGRLGVSVLPPDTDGGGELRVWTVHFAECDNEGNELAVLYDTTTTINIPFLCLTASGITTEGSVYEDDGSAYLESLSEGTFFYIKDLNIPLEKGKYYQLTVTMKQRGMNKNYTCAPTVQMYKYESAGHLDAELVKSCCEELFAEAEAVGIPLFYGDIGISSAAATHGGKQYMTDLLSVIETLGQSYVEK